MSTPSPTVATGHVIMDLDHPDAADPAVTGAKAAALAAATEAGLPALPGVVLTTDFTAAVDSGASVVGHPTVTEAFERIGGADRSLVARSSSTLEDQSGSSMAGQFESVIGIDGLDEFEQAVIAVLASRDRADLAGTPIAVLVQPLIDPEAGGVMFGIDPVTGRSDRRVVSAVEGAPEPLVSGNVEGSRYLLDPTGRRLETDIADGAEIGDRVLRSLVELGQRSADLFGGPQDIEWAVQPDGTVHLLQSRAVTTEIRGVPDGPVFGPGPVAETFPEPLSRLEADIWVTPLRGAVREAVRLAGAATDAAIAASEAVIVVGGIVAIDLELTGEDRPEIRLRDRLNPIPGARRLRSAWRVGRLRAALPGLAEDLLDRVDADLEASPPLPTLTSRQLVALVGRGREVLHALHAQEMLMGLLTDPGDSRMTGASVALRILSEARRDGMDDAHIIQTSPVVLALTPPRCCGCAALPPPAQTTALLQAGGRSSDAAVVREALRLRVRWMQEITGRAMWELGGRMTEEGALAETDDVRHLGFDDVEAIVSQRAQPRRQALNACGLSDPEPLPARFQLSERGRPIAFRRGDEVGGGTGAGGGVGSGVVTHDTDDPPTGSVLVTDVLRPGLGPLLPRLTGIVSETGSVLSHLAILARESAVAIVVGYPDAIESFPEGTRLIVDGESGEITLDGNDIDSEETR